MGRKKTTPDYPKCPFKLSDCFALIPGHLCYCLEDTNFDSERECPFYKTEKEFIQDNDFEVDNK